MKRFKANIVREYDMPGVSDVHGVSYDGNSIWVATGDALCALDPGTGNTVHMLKVQAQAGTAFDGKHLFQIAGDRIQKIDPKSGAVIATVPTPEGGAAGMAWAEGSLWVGQHRNRKIHQVDPDSGAILRTIEATRFVTGVTWLGDELWHGTWQDDQSDLRRVDPKSGAVLEQIDMPPGMVVSGLESDGRDTFFCGGGPAGKVRAVARPR
jgi:glutamine cyclotransferase